MIEFETIDGYTIYKCIIKTAVAHTERLRLSSSWCNWDAKLIGDNPSLVLLTLKIKGEALTITPLLKILEEAKLPLPEGLRKPERKSICDLIHYYTVKSMHELECVLHATNGSLLTGEHWEQRITDIIARGEIAFLIEKKADNVMFFETYSVGTFNSLLNDIKDEVAELIASTNNVVFYEMFVQNEQELKIYTEALPHSRDKASLRDVFIESIREKDGGFVIKFGCLVQAITRDPVTVILSGLLAADLPIPGNKKYPEVCEGVAYLSDAIDYRLLYLKLKMSVPGNPDDLAYPLYARVNLFEVTNLYTPSEIIFQTQSEIESRNRGLQEAQNRLKYLQQKG
jgi:hypothetical protein